MGNTLAVWCVILGGVMVLVPVLFIVLILTLPRDWERHTVRVILPFLLAAVFGVWYTPPASFTVGSLLLAYGVAALAHASRPATLNALGIALLCCILIWGSYLVRILKRRRERRNSSTDASE